MKRIIGRKMADDQTQDYGSYKVPAVNFDLLDVDSQRFRYRWASDIIDNLRSAGSVTYNALDIGTYDGIMAALMATKHLTPGDNSSPTTNVDAIEAHKESFEAANQLATVVRSKGFKMNVYNTTIEEFKPDKMYDVVIAFEVLEHTKDPLFNIEKIYDMLEIGGHLLITVPEEHGNFGIRDKNAFHYWTSTVQSLVSTMFYDDRKWHIKQCFEVETLIHVQVQKMSYQA